jgi:Alginate export
MAKRAAADMLGMSRILRLALPAALALAFVVTLAARPCDDENPPASAKKLPDGEPMLDWSPAESLPGWLHIGGQVRGRFEAVSGASLLNSNADNYYLSRIRVDLAIKPVHWLRFVVQAQDARVGAYNTAPAPSTIYNPMDLRQGYVEFAFEGRASVKLRAGRQELSFGGERLIGPADWNMSRTYDALDLTLSMGRSKVDLLAGSAVQVDPTRFDRHKPGEHFYAAYGSIGHLLPGMTVEPYLLFKQNLLIKSESSVLGDAIVASPGVRVAGKLPGRFDYVGEAIVQRGSYSADHISARAASGVLGWMVANAGWKPRVSVEYSYASGDPTSKDGNRNTFDQFYPSNHGYYGMIDQFGWKNLKNFRAGFDFLAVRKLKLRADYNDFRLATVQDSLYNSSGSSIVLNRRATSASIGSEISTVALYQWNKIWKFGAGIGHLYAGDYLKESKCTSGYTYPYVMFMGTF